EATRPEIRLGEVERPDDFTEPAAEVRRPGGTDIVRRQVELRGRRLAGRDDAEESLSTLVGGIPWDAVGTKREVVVVPLQVVPLVRRVVEVVAIVENAPVPEDEVAVLPGQVVRHAGTRLERALERRALAPVVEIVG